MGGDGWGKEEPPRSGFFNCGDADEDTVGVKKSASNLYVAIFSDGDDS